MKKNDYMNITQPNMENREQKPRCYRAKRSLGLFLLLVLVMGFLTLTACGKEQAETKEPLPELNGNYVEILADSLDQALLMNVDEARGTMQFYNVTMGRTYTLSYNGTTSIQNKYGDELVAGQLKSGDYVYVAFVKDQKFAKTIQLSDEANTHTTVKTFEFNYAGRKITFDGETYTLDKNMAVLSQGNQIELEEINAVDTLKVVEKDHKVYGITVENGHGYVRLTNYESFVGGWIEIGSVIQKVTEEMLLAVPEGDYTMYISNQGVIGNKEVSVKVGEEVEVDVADLQTEVEKQNGTLIFTISPQDATLLIDGVEMDYSKPVELSCGIHQIRVKATGYTTKTQYIKVGTGTANLNIQLEQGDEDASDDSSTSVSSNSVTTPSTASKYRVYIDSPEGAELYVDGSYVGVVPVSFSKSSGTHIVSLRKDGYTTRSYTLQIDDEEKDVTYSFSDLVAK